MKKYLKILIFLAYLGLVAYACFGHFENVPDITKTFLGIPMDKLVHFIMFFPFPILCYMLTGRFGSNWKAVLGMVVIFLIGCLLASGTELVQSKLAYRGAEVADFRADCISLAISSLIVFILDVSRKRK